MNQERRNNGISGRQFTQKAIKKFNKEALNDRVLNAERDQYPASVTVPDFVNGDRVTVG